ncbi:nucleotide exchange factor GrpE [Candidatus Wolfebacteria bacterium GWA1_42_9]|uniref:Protein GrpE n=1 Tax=Candidatus Wolfebacteria bacterium GWA1_42_9 TaxID=1802553 RepID=A0A1F8DP45_9BACT|nr:MAG: Protein GrpE [Parcubacteria group bacterium GW2011_GWB1_43_8b]OGM89595.1 MAG: nucleotide exchange factor GrpE [Candidatus Wolfebacteria bacterium GWA1_42_9]
MDEPEKKEEEAKNKDATPASQAGKVSESDKLAKERDEYLDGWKRTKADLINYKKDEAKRFEALVRFANEQIIRDLIVVLDSFDLSIASLGGESKAEKGIYLIRSQLEDALKSYGLERLSVSVGQNFDPSVHDAVVSVESDKPSGTIVEEVEKGYMLNGKLIRPARVKVAK